MQNPYQPPLESQRTESSLPTPRRSPSPMVRHVRIVAICMGSVGVVELFVGVSGLLVAGMFLFARWLPGGERFAAQLGSSASYWFILGFYAAVGLIHSAVAVLHLVASYQNYFYRGHKLGIAAMIVGLSTLLLGCCAPTAIGVAVYGMVVYFNDSVKQAFEMGQAGYSAEQIAQAFADPPPGDEPQSVQ